MGTWVAAFKANRHLFVQDFYQLLPQPQTAEDWDAVQFVSYTGDEAAVFAFAGSRSGEVVLKLRGLRRDEKYIIVRLPDGAAMTISGEALMNAGLPVALSQNEGGLWRIRVER